MSDFHDDITQTPAPPAGDTPSEAATTASGDPSGLGTDPQSGDPGRVGDRSTPVADRQEMRRRLREDQGAEHADEGPPAESPPAEAPIESPATTETPNETPTTTETTPKTETPNETPTATETTPRTETPKTGQEKFDEMIRSGIETLTVENPYAAPFEETDGLYLHGLENPDEFMAPTDGDGRPIDTGDDDFGLGGLN